MSKIAVSDRAIQATSDIARGVTTRTDVHDQLSGSTKRDLMTRKREMADLAGVAYGGAE